MRKIVLVIVLLVLLVLVYFAVFSNSFDQGLAELRVVEQSFNVGSNFLLPGTQTELANYKNDLTLLKRKYLNSQPFGRLVDVKLSLVLVGEDLFFFGDEFSKINKINPNCSSGGEIELLKNKALEIERGYNTVLSKRNSFINSYPSEAQKATELSSESFEDAMNGSILGVGQMKNIVESYCQFV